MQPGFPTTEVYSPHHAVYKPLEPVRRRKRKAFCRIKTSYPRMLISDTRDGI